MAGAICYAHPTPLTVGMGALLMSGTLVSYVPWWLTLVRRRNAEGVSCLTLSVGLLAGLLNLINACILTWERLTCCGTHVGTYSAAQCVANNLVVEQLSVGTMRLNRTAWLTRLGPACLFLVYVLVLIYHPRHPVRAYRVAWLSFLLAIALAVLATMAAIVVYYGDLLSGPAVMTYGQTLGIAAAVLTFVQWAPQIYITWKAQSSGALSLSTLLVQTPGNVLVVVFQLSANSHWTSWAPYIVSGLEMLVLIVMLAYFHIRKKLAAKPVMSVLPVSHGTRANDAESASDEDLPMLVRRVYHRLTAPGVH